MCGEGGEGRMQGQYEFRQQDAQKRIKEKEATAEREKSHGHTQ